jgi:MFS family permease
MGIKVFTRYLLLIGVAYLLLFYSFLQMDLMNPLSKTLIKELNLNQSQFGLLASLFFYVNMLLIIPAGICLDRYGPKLTICTALLLTLLGTSIFALHPTFATAIVWRRLSGVLGALAVIGPIMLITRIFEKRWVARAIGGFGFVAMSAGIIAQTPVTLMIQHLGMHTTLLIDVFLGVVLFGFILYTIDEHHRKYMSLRRQGQMIGWVYLNKVNLGVAFLASLINTPLFILGAGWGNLYLQTGHHIAAEDSSNILSMVFIGNIVGTLLFGYVSKHSRSRLLLMLMGSVVCAASLIGLVSGVISNVNFYYVIVFLIGFATGSQILAYALMIDLHHRALHGKATSIVSLFSVGFGAIMQTACGYIDVSRVSTLFILCAVTSIALAVFLNLRVIKFQRNPAQVHV